jgi:hypothetical protein
VALFQFFKAGFLFLIFWRAWEAHQSWVALGNSAGDPFVKQLIENPFLLLFPVFAIGFIIIGGGLWNLRDWARETLIYAALLCWANGGISTNGLFFGKSAMMFEWSKGTLLSVFLIDFFVVGCLAYYPGVAKAFGGRNA